MKKYASDTIKDILLELRKSQGQDMQDTDVITRYEWATGSAGIRTSGCRIYMKNIAGDTLIWGNQGFGIWNTYKWGDTATQSFILGHLQAGILGTSLLGTQNSAWTLYWSGGYP